MRNPYGSDWSSIRKAGLKDGNGEPAPKSHQAQLLMARNTNSCLKRRYEEIAKSG